MQELKRDIRVIALILIRISTFCLGFTVHFIRNTVQEYKRHKAK